MTASLVRMMLYHFCTVACAALGNVQAPTVVPGPSERVGTPDDKRANSCPNQHGTQTPFPAVEDTTTCPTQTTGPNPPGYTFTHAALADCPLRPASLYALHACLCCRLSDSLLTCVHIPPLPPSPTSADLCLRLLLAGRRSLVFIIAHAVQLVACNSFCLTELMDF